MFFCVCIFQDSDADDSDKEVPPVVKEIPPVVIKPEEWFDEEWEDLPDIPGPAIPSSTATQTEVLTVMDGVTQTESPGVTSRTTSTATQTEVLTIDGATQTAPTESPGVASRTRGFVSRRQ